MKTHEFAFDVKLWAAVRINAPSLDAARRGLAAILDAAEPTNGWVEGYNGNREGCTITEVSVQPETTSDMTPYEVDGEEPGPEFDPENIYNLPGIQQSIEEERK